MQAASIKFLIPQHTAVVISSLRSNCHVNRLLSAACIASKARRMWRGPASCQLPMHTFQQLPLQCTPSWAPLLSHGPPLPVIGTTCGMTLRETLMHALQASARGRVRPPGPWQRGHLGGQATITRLSCVGTTKLVAQQEHAVPAAFELRPDGSLPKPLQRLQLQPGEVHVWWLFPDDVRALAFMDYEYCIEITALFIGVTEISC